MEKVLDDMFVKVCKNNCSKCQYRTWYSSYLGCGYILTEGHSRIFNKEGKPRFPKNYCDKFVPDNKEYKIQKLKDYHHAMVVSIPKED